jgi:hypothetical protein
LISAISGIPLTLVLPVAVVEVAVPAPVVVTGLVLLDLVDCELLTELVLLEHEIEIPISPTKTSIDINAVANESFMFSSESLSMTEYCWFLSYIAIKVEICELSQ